MEVLKIFEEKFQNLVKNKVKSVILENNENENEALATPHRAWSPDKNNPMACSYCRTHFESPAQQREHFKLDWHRYNLRQSLLQKPPITEEDFAKKTTEDDLSSISGSDSEKDENLDTLDSYATAQGKIFLQSASGKVFSMYACLLSEKKEELNDAALSHRVKTCVSNQKWAVLMLGGGHFAGAIFDKDQPIVHKTFHCYTVRAGQGGAQSSRDSKSGGAHPKSAGASLRRYNEQALVQHVRGIVEAWRGELEGCGLVFYRAAGPYNRGVLFGGPAPLFERGDGRLRSVPFSTRRATFAEVNRVHSVLTLAQVYDSLDSAVQSFAKITENTKRSKIKSPCIDRAKSRELVERPLPVEKVSESSSEDGALTVEDLEISFDSLREFEDSINEKKVKKKKKKPKKSKTKKLKEEEERRKKELVEVLSRGQVDKLRQLLENLTEDSRKEDFVNEVLDEEGNTFLHVAALNEQKEILEFVLENEGNPCLKNAKQQTPYTCTPSKIIRESLKQFARENPDKFNYNKANIPTNFLTPEELSEKKKAQRRVKKEKEKIKKKENEIKKQEEMEKERFLKLSDREKRALAAERRILSKSGSVLFRCFLCGGDMTGKVPFEYLNNRFCSVDCLKAHRMQNPVVLS